MGSAGRVLVVGAAVLTLATTGHATTGHATTGHANAHADRPTLRLMAHVTNAATQATAPAAAPVRTAETRACAAGLVALTFDDGPDRTLTPKLVRILQDHHVPATFFMIGSRIRSAPRIARAVAEAGFTIGNHTWDHPQLTRLSDRAIRREIRSTTRELRAVGIVPGTLMRPPYGDIDARVRTDIRDLGLVPVLWNVDSNDWRGGSARQIAASILGQLRRHRDNVVLQHDGVLNSPASVAAVPRVIREARRRGYCFGRLGPHGHVLPATPAPVAAVGTVRVVPTRGVASPVGSPFDVVLDRPGAWDGRTSGLRLQSS